MKTAVCAIAKNENNYIREWIEWYKELGVSKIFLYDNNDCDGEHFEDVILDYINSKFVELIDKRGIAKTVSTDEDGQSLQGLCYQDCYDNHYKEYDWICFFDIDEFLEIDKSYTLSSLLKTFNDDNYDGIRVQWRMYGDNNLLKYDNRSINERFHYENNFKPSSLIKTILKGKKHHKDNLLFCAHGPLKISGRYKQITLINLDGSLAANPYRNKFKLADNMPAYLNHFFCKSTEEYINRKWKKTSAVTGINYTRNFNYTFIKDEYFKINDKTVEKERAFSKLIKEDKIIVNFTTWKKRDKCVIELLTHINNNQTLLPDEIICWLSVDEYNYKLPESIKYCLDNNLLSKVKWVKGNTYGHKRYETFKYNNNVYNILMDDDIYYPNDYIESLYLSCKKNPDCVSSYYTRKEIYKDGWRTYTDMVEEPSIENRYFSGLSAFPPNLFPVETFKYTNLRDKYCQKCDDSWINAWLIKKDIPIIGLHNWGKRSPLKCIENTQEVGIYDTHNGIKINGIMQVCINIANALYLCNVENKMAIYWPEFPINKIKTCSERIEFYKHTRANCSILLCCIVKNENNYIEEWVKHYQNLGVDKIVIYDNDTDKNEYVENVPYIQQYINSKYIDVYHIPNKIAWQKEAYTECYQKYNREYDWLMFFDIDEYLMLENSISIKEELAKSQFTNYDMIHVNWKIYDDNNIIRCNNDYSVVKRFTHQYTKVSRVNKEIKSIIRGGLDGIEFTLNPHTVTNKVFNCCDPLGNKILSVQQYNLKICHHEMWLNHYICKTAEEFIKIKLKRMGGSTKHDVGLRYNLEFFFNYNEKTPEKIEYFKNEIIKNFSQEDAQKILKSKVFKQPKVKKMPEALGTKNTQTKENTTIKIINKPTIVKTLEPYKLPVKSISRRY